MKTERQHFLRGASNQNSWKTIVLTNLYVTRQKKTKPELLKTGLYLLPEAHLIGLVSWDSTMEMEDLRFHPHGAGTGCCCKGSHTSNSQVNSSLTPQPLQIYMVSETVMDVTKALIWQQLQSQEVGVVRKGLTWLLVAKAPLTVAVSPRGREGEADKGTPVPAPLCLARALSLPASIPAPFSLSIMELALNLATLSYSTAPQKHLVQESVKVACM